MKKSGVLTAFAFAVLFFASFVLAENCTLFSYSEWGSCSSGVQTRTIVNSSPINCTGGNPVLRQNCTATTSSTVASTTTNSSNIEKGFSCLVAQTKSDCSGASTIQEIALTIMASSNNTAKCIERLKTFKKADCFGQGSSCTVKETALAILALNHVGEQTGSYASWLLNRTRISTDVLWQLQQDSEGKTACKINYDSQDYSFNVLENKKIDVAAGNCFSLTQSNYWFQVSPNCYEKEFSIICDQSFSISLMYKIPNSQVLYLLSDTKTANANNPISVKLKSKCFGDNSCDYEASLWAALALDKTGNDISDYTPYLIAAEESNRQYLPSAFLHMIIDYTEYGTKLLKLQKQNYWEADGSAYNKYYDTALALLALSLNKNQPQVLTATDWLKNLAQDSDGCWNNKNIRDTAMALWALEGRRPSITSGSLTQCVDAGFVCRNLVDCASGDRLSNYVCGSSIQTCCKPSDLKTCSELGGTICGSDKQCSGIEEVSSDGRCCTSFCEDRTVVQNECQLERGTCKSTCGSGQDDIGADCGSASLKCCKTSTEPKQSSLMWLWILLIILIILIIVAIIFRDRLKVWWFKTKSKFGEDKNGGTSGGRGGGIPPSSPGMRPMMPANRPPLRPQQPIARPLQQQRPAQVKKSADDDVFAKLRNMGK